MLMKTSITHDLTCLQVRSAAVMKKREGDFSISYADVAATACKTGNNPKYAKYARAFR
jgi:hypothetical protein